MLCPSSSSCSASSFQQLRRGEHAADVVIGRQEGDGLVNHMFLILEQFVFCAPLDELDHPARVQVHTKTDPFPSLGQVLDGQAQSTRARGAQHEPVSPPGKVLLGQGFGKQLVINAEVFDVDPGLGNPRCASRFENTDGAIRQALGYPSAHRPPAQPVVFEVAEPFEILEPLDSLSRIPAGLLCPLEPERAASLGAEMPLDQSANVSVQFLAVSLYVLFCST